MSPTALFYKEKEYLKPLPDPSIIEQYLRPNEYLVFNESLIRYNSHKYSVDPSLIGEEVTVDVLDKKLYIYYNGKLITYHEINGKPVQYHTDHYTSLMKGKVKSEDLETVVNENLHLRWTIFLKEITTRSFIDYNSFFQYKFLISYFSISFSV